MIQHEEIVTTLVNERMEWMNKANTQELSEYRKRRDSLREVFSPILINWCENYEKEHLDVVDLLESDFIETQKQAREVIIHRLASDECVQIELVE